MTTLIHRTNAPPFEAFQVRNTGRIEGAVIWFGLPKDVDELAFYGENICVADVDLPSAETIVYTDVAEDGDPMYVPEVMAAVLAHTEDAPVVRIRKVTMFEHGQPTTVYAVRDPSLIRIIEWVVPDE